MTAPLILWFRRDLRLHDNPLLAEGLAAHAPLLPLFILDPETEAIGAAARARLGLGVAALQEALSARGSRLVLRRGPAEDVLMALVREVGAAGVLWGRSYDPALQPRDATIKAALAARGVRAASLPGFLLHEPWRLTTAAGGGYRVFTAFWSALRAQDPASPLADPPARLTAPPLWPASDCLADWRLEGGLSRGAPVLARFRPHAGEGAARARLRAFLSGPVASYATARDRLDIDGTSGLSAALAWGEIAPQRLWHEARRLMAEGPPGTAAGAEAFLRQLGWRDFAWHLLHHFPELGRRNWRAGWDSFPWAGESAAANRWRQGMTGEPLVDAAMRALFVTGQMPNRARMIVASYLTKHLLTDWRLGLGWFAECLSDWDPASNALGWQWVAGSGPDAAPFFRIFNPETQAARYDPGGRFRHRNLAELAPRPDAAPPEALAFFEAAPRAWRLDPARPYPAPVIDLAEGRARALAALRQGNT